MLCVCVCVRGVAVLCARRRQRTERIVAGRLGNEVGLAALLCRWPFVTSLPMVVPCRRPACDVTAFSVLWHCFLCALKLWSVTPPLFLPVDIK